MQKVFPVPCQQIAVWPKTKYLMEINLRLLNEMSEAFLSSGRKEFIPSQYWLVLNKKNLEQLEKYGYDNFKRTAALNYFIWIASPWDEQIKGLIRKLPVLSILKNSLLTILAGKHDCLSLAQSMSYNFVTYMDYDCVHRNFKLGLFDSIREPEEGNPPRVYSRGKLISQDLANSLLEFESVMNSGIDRNGINTVMELGAGYGRTAYAYLKLIPSLRYFVVDIPPALYISQTYLSRQFKEKKIFSFRKFSEYSQIRDELENSDIAFFLPSQLELLPDKSVDLFINISSFQEMRPDQIDYFFEQIDRLTGKYFFFKEWKISRIPYDNLVIREEDYPVKKSWQLIYRKECLLQSQFFEALYKVK